MNHLQMLADQAIFKEAELYIRLFISTILGLFIGWDRSSHNKPAGIKTYTYVTVSCTLIKSFLLRVLPFCVRLTTER